MRYLVPFLLAMAVDLSSAIGAISPIAISGEGVPGLADAKFATFTTPSVNSAGAGVFRASLQQGEGGITADDDEVAFRFDTNGLALLARKGSGSVPGVIDADFNTFAAVAIDDQGNALLRGTLQQAGSITSSNNQGIWHYSSNGALIARSGSQGVPGIASTSFGNFLTDTLRLSANGHFSFNSTVTFGSSITTSNDRGLWSYLNTTGSLVLQKGTHYAAGVEFTTFNTFIMPAINDISELAFNGVLTIGSGVTTSNRSGIWKYSVTGTQGVLLARAGTVGIPGLPNEAFTAFTPPVINNGGQVAFNATTSASNGIWLSTNDVIQLKAVTNAGGVPGIPDAHFSAFRNVLLSDTGDILFGATLQTGLGGVGSNNNQGLWMMDNAGDDRLILRTGSGGVPAIADANFLDFTSYSINEAGCVALAASLEIGPGNVTLDNDFGLWVVDPNGGSTLVAREGDSLAGRTIESLHFLADSGGSDGHSTGFNQFNQLLFQATFTNGDEGIFLYSPSTLPAFSPADFNLDGYVDATDLSSWREAYGTSAVGDADNDGDTDGADFLIWQREYTGPATPLDPLAVPEPSVCWLLVIALGLSQHRIGGRSVRN